MSAKVLVGNNLCEVVVDIMLGIQHDGKTVPRYTHKYLSLTRCCRTTNESFF